MYGFIITNAIMVIIKTIDYKYRNILYIKMKNNSFINYKLTYLEKKDHEEWYSIIDSSTAGRIKITLFPKNKKKEWEARLLH